ncbi:MAG: hypothetical protein WDN25_13015 [Acetobacteraceae bacterium]
MKDADDAIDNLVAAWPWGRRVAGRHGRVRHRQLHRARHRHAGGSAQRGAARAAEAQSHRMPIASVLTETAIVLVVAPRPLVTSSAELLRRLGSALDLPTFVGGHRR